MVIEEFDDVEEIFKKMRRDMDEADKRVKPWQTRIKEDDYFVRSSRLGFPIYGQVLSEEERRPRGLQHYRLCRCYSVACPKGEMGDVHVSVIDALITTEDFEEAKSRGWFP